MPRELNELEAESFEQCLHQTFHIHVAEQDAIEAELIEVRGLTQSGGSQRQPFSVVLRGPRDAALQQGIFKVENERLGELEIFLVTLGPDGEGMRYEAVFT